MTGWIGVDFDGTLAYYEHWISADNVGTPVPSMVERVKRWLAEGREVRIFTARVWPLGTIWQDVQQASVQKRVGEAIVAKKAIERWSKEHLGTVLEITCVKDFGMIELYDDRAVQVTPNTGEIVGQSTRGL